VVKRKSTIGQTTIYKIYYT